MCGITNAKIECWNNIRIIGIFGKCEKTFFVKCQNNVSHSLLEASIKICMGVFINLILLSIFFTRNISYLAYVKATNIICKINMEQKFINILWKMPHINMRTVNKYFQMRKIQWYITNSCYAKYKIVHFAQIFLWLKSNFNRWDSSKVIGQS